MVHCAQRSGDNNGSQFYCICHNILFVYCFFRIIDCTILHLCVCMCVCARAVQAGLVTEMSNLASRFMTEGETREEVMSEAESVAESHDDPQ